MLSRILGGVGRSLITAGTLILLFVAYQLWGTGLQEAKSQRALSKEFAAKTAEIRRSTTTSTSTTPTTTAPGVTTTTGTGLTAVPTKPVDLEPDDIPLPKYGEAIAQIRIKKIGLTRTVVEGVGLDQLKRGPGHYPETPLPGQAGNAAIAGHRTTYGQPFHNLDKLDIGDQIEVTTFQRPDQPFVYRIDSITVVRPDQSEVLVSKKRPDGKLENRLTLTACHPKYSAAKRLIVSGILVGTPVPEIKGQSKAREKANDQRSKGDGAGNEATIDGGLSGVKQPRTPAVLWGLACALIWLATWLVQTLLRRRMRRGIRAEALADDVDHPFATPDAAPARARKATRRERLLTWTPYVIGLPIFLVGLYFFFESFARLLPGNY